MKCSVCANEINERYCSNCGQYRRTKKINGLTLLQDLFGNMFSLEKSFFENLKLAFNAPKTLVTNYWNGFRGYYYSPSKFLVIASLFFVLQLMVVNDFLGIWVNSKVSQQFTLLFVNIIIFSILSFITYWKFKRSIYEHVILNIYTVSLWSIIFVPISIILNQLNAPKPIKTGFLFAYLLLIIIWNSRIFELKKGKRLLYILINILLFVVPIWLLFNYAATK